MVLNLTHEGNQTVSANICRVRTCLTSLHRLLALLTLYVLQMTRTMVAESLSKVLEPMGFAPGKPGAFAATEVTAALDAGEMYWLLVRPGLARCIKQMQVSPVRQ